VIRDDRRPKKPGELEPAVAVGRTHHGNLDVLIAQSSDTSGPFSFDRSSPFEVEAELAKESDRRFEVFDDDSYVVHSFKRHVFNLQGGPDSDNGPWCNRLLQSGSSNAMLCTEKARQCAWHTRVICRGLASTLGLDQVHQVSAAILEDRGHYGPQVPRSVTESDTALF
jgi:hypothetical protein